MKASKEKSGALAVTTSERGKFLCKEASLELGKQTWESWKRIGRSVGILVSASPWYVADWLLFGERQFGERYADAVDITGLSPERLRVLAWVGERFTPDLRRPELSFEAHRELAAIRDAKELKRILNFAADNKWGSKQIRAWKRGDLVV